MDYLKFYDRALKEHLSVFSMIDQIKVTLITAGLALVRTNEVNNKIIICGNGGSAADSQHFAAELIGRFEMERLSLPAVALTTDTSALTALGNDFGYDFVFSRQVEGLGTRGDTLIGISTSGNSSNIITAVEAAKKKKIKTIGLLGKDGGRIAPLVDTAVVVPHENTARIQEAHIFIIHFWCSMIEQALFGSGANSHGK